VPLADLAKHPADSLVDKVFAVVEQALGDLDRVGKIILADEMVGRDNADSPLPEAPRCGESIQGITSLVNQVPADNLPLPRLRGYSDCAGFPGSIAPS